MYRLLSRLSLACVIASLSYSVASEPIDLYYFVNQRAYLVDSTKDGMPVLDKEVSSDATDFSETRHKAWWYQGELPLDRVFARAIVDYSLKRVPQPYGQRDAEETYSLNVRWERILPEFPKNERKGRDWLLLGWVHDGSITDLLPIQPSRDWVHQVSNSSLFIPLSRIEGKPVVWHLRKGDLVRKPELYSWDWLIDGGTSKAEASEAIEKDTQDRGEIFYAAANGELEKVRELLAGNKKLAKAIDNSEYLPIRYAAENGRSEVVSELRASKSPIVDGWGDLNSVVMSAATNGHFETLKTLMPSKPKGETDRWHCSWAASEALNENYEDIARYLLAFKPNIDYDDAVTEKIVLNKLSQGYPEIGFGLMERYGVKPNFEVEGYTPLHFVASYADESLLTKFSSYGLDPRKLAKDGTEPLDFAIGGGNVEAICWFVDNRKEAISDEYLAGAFAHAINKGKISSVECLLGYGYNINVEIKKGVSPLLYALAQRRYDIARLLIDHGAVFEFSSAFAEMLASRVIEGDRLDLLRFLTSNGFKWNQKVAGGLSIASAAEAVGASDILQFLDQSGTDAGEKGQVRTLGHLTEQPKLLTPIAVNYPDQLRAEFGSRTEVIEVVLSKEGQPLFVIPQNEHLPRELLGVIEPAVLDLKFMPGSVDGEAVPVILKTAIPLKADFELAEVFSLTDVDEKPRALRMATPIYPYSMMKSKTEGRVVVEFILMANGMVRDVRPVKSTHTAFEAPAVSCVVFSSWQPAQSNGKRVSCRVRIPIDFNP